MSPNGEFFERGSEAWYTKRSNEAYNEGNVVQNYVCLNSCGVNAALEELRYNKSKLVTWMDENEPEQWEGNVG